MAGRKRKAPESVPRRVSSRLQSSLSSSSSSPRPRAGNATASRNAAVPDVYREMLAEARAEAEGLPDRPQKRKRPGERTPQNSGITRGAAAAAAAGSVAELAALGWDEEEINEQSTAPENVEPVPAPTVQTILRESEDEDEDEDDDIEFEDVDIGGAPGPEMGQTAEAPRELSLNLTAQKAAMTSRRVIDRRKPVSREEKERRVEIHKMHLLCLLSHVQRRNWWCNDPGVQETLRPLLSAKMARFLDPDTSLPQFSRSESLKTGVKEAKIMFDSKFVISERGLRRALWAEDEEQLQNYQLPDDIESTLDRKDFLAAAKTLRGSRDVGAQLFCALLRSAGVRARLVCSLQPLSCVPGAPTMPNQRATKPLSKAAARAAAYKAAMAVYEAKHTQPINPSSVSSPRRRLGHPNATDYHVPQLPDPSSENSSSSHAEAGRPILGESPFPVYWVEALDVAYQKWQPVDPLVTHTQWNPRALEPPASDAENCMTYVVAFDADGSAKDVTRRYAKAYNAKTLKMRIDKAISDNGSTTRLPKGERWWRRVMRFFAAALDDDDDPMDAAGQIEDNELAALVAKEPMPRNVADFKDHPLYALERHLRRHEVLVPGAKSSGAVGAGSKGSLERIYRRRDVRVARSRDKWYRLGRLVKAGEEPVKILPKRTSRKSTLYGDRRGDYDEDEEDEDEDEDDPDKVGLFGDAVVGGTPIYMLEQTEPYEAPPVVNGRVPKNKFGNIDVYVPSMVPRGGAHVAHERAAQAAFILGVDYAPALTGFRFKGRRGTAVLDGAVVPRECEEAVRAVIAGLVDLDAELEQERKTARILRLWSRFLKGLRIRERVWAGADPDEEGEEIGEETADKGKGRAVEENNEEEEGVDFGNAPSDVSEEFVMQEDDEGGGFLIE